MPSTWRRSVRMMAPWASGENTGDMVQSGFNESGFPPSPRALEAAHLAAARARTCRDHDYVALRRALACHYDLDGDRIVCGAPVPWTSWDIWSTAAWSAGGRC